jgi:hypothetical protein
MSKKILILTDSIAPPAYAPRVVSLCKYLHSQGWHCTVFSDRLPGVELFGNNDATWWQTQYYGNKQTISRYIADKIGNQREREFYNYIVSKVDIASFDCILCSSYYYFPLRTTQRLAKKYHIPYMVDLRDIAEQWGNIPYATTHIQTSLPRGLDRCGNDPCDYHPARYRHSRATTLRATYATYAKTR